MPSLSDPDRPKPQPSKLTTAPKGLDESLENAPVARQVVTAVLPPPAVELSPTTVQAKGQDYTNLTTCGGFGYDRPISLDELQEATHARFLVAAGKCTDAGIEDFTYYHKWGSANQKTDIATKYMQEGRLIAYASPGDNEGYIVQILAAPTYLDRDTPIPIAHSKCWSREGSLALLHEVSELMVRW